MAVVRGRPRPAGPWVWTSEGLASGDGTEAVGVLSEGRVLSPGDAGRRGVTTL